MKNPLNWFLATFLAIIILSFFFVIYPESLWYREDGRQNIWVDRIFLPIYLILPLLFLIKAFPKEGVYKWRILSKELLFFFFVTAAIYFIPRFVVSKSVLFFNANIGTPEKVIISGTVTELKAWHPKNNTDTFVSYDVTLKNEKLGSTYTFETKDTFRFKKVKLNQQLSLQLNKGCFNLLYLKK